MNEHATPRSLFSEESERGSRSSGCLIVVVVSLFVLLGRCVLRGAKKHPTAVILGTSVSIRVPARLPLVSTARALRSAR